MSNLNTLSISNNTFSPNLIDFVHPEHSNYITLKDSLSNNQTQLEFYKNQNINIYACGITPYSHSHIGHTRSYAVFDLLTQTLKLLSANPILVRNITDIDDKIINESIKQNIPWYELSNHYSQLNRELMQQTFISIPIEPAASNYIKDIEKIIQSLINKGFAYQSNGSVYFNVAKYTGPLLMQHKNENLLSNNDQSRVDTFDKINPSDFALWKKANLDDIGFNSIFGFGRPGWHIECSAIIENMFNSNLDIHGGGVDLKFPHHQSEIMQSFSYTGKNLAKIWMHNGSVTVNKVKMSKSLNNYITWADALYSTANYTVNNGALLKLSMLLTSYQKPMDWNPDIFNKANKYIKILENDLFDANIPSIDQINFEIINMLNILQKNLNFPMLLSYFDSKIKAKSSIASSYALAKILNVNIKKPEAIQLLDENIEKLLALRKIARENKDFALSDKLRDQLLNLNYKVIDDKL